MRAPTFLMPLALVGLGTASHAATTTPVQAFAIEGNVDIATLTRCYSAEGVPVTHNPHTQVLSFRCEGRAWSCLRSSARYDVGLRKFTFTCQSLATVNAQAALTLYPAIQAINTGGTAQMEVVLTNQGATALQNVVVDVPAAPGCNRTWASVAAGTTVSGLCSKSAVNADTEVVASLTATRGGQGVAVQSRSYIRLNGPRVSVAATPDQQSVAAGSSAPLRVSVLNAGNVALTDLAAVDDRFAACSGQRAGSTAVGAGFTFNCLAGPLFTGPHNGRIDAIGNTTSGAALGTATYRVDVTPSHLIHANGFE